MFLSGVLVGCMTAKEASIGHPNDLFYKWRPHTCIPGHACFLVNEASGGLVWDPTGKTGAHTTDQTFPLCLAHCAQCWFVNPRFSVNMNAGIPKLVTRNARIFSAGEKRPYLYAPSPPLRKSGCVSCRAVLWFWPASRGNFHGIQKIELILDESSAKE